MKAFPPSHFTPSPPDKPTTAGAKQPHIVMTTRMANATVDSVQHATRDPKFAPGARQAFFSTELGTRSPRQLSFPLMPTVARSYYNAEAVVYAAKYWQTKYKNQCLCILPDQGWVVEDLWDAVDIHVEGRKFCEQMLLFIARDTWYAADRFAKDWARKHLERVNFTDIRIGDVYDLNDPLTALDRIFIFGELNTFPRVFLWHVAFILIADWIDASLVNAPAFNGYQDQYLSAATQRSAGKAKESAKASTSDGRKAVSSPDDTARTDSVAHNTPDQSNLQLPPQRIKSDSPHPVNEQQGLTRYNDIERMTGLPIGPPNMRAQALKGHKGTRNLGSPPYSQPRGWVENESRVISGPYLGPQPIPVPGMQAHQYVPPPIAVGPHMNKPMIPGSAMSPYVLGPPVLSPGHPVQQMEPAMLPRGHMHYPPGMTRGLHIPPAYVDQPKGSQPVLIGNATNIHFPGFMGSQVVDSHAPMPRRVNHQSANQLYDPYNGNSRKSSGGQGHNDIGKKGGPTNFIPPHTRGRKASTSSGRLSYSSHNHMPSTGSRFSETSNRIRLSEDDTNITGDSIYGCGHTWIGPKNATVKELWIGDLPPDVSESELMQLFEQTVGITPISISLKSNITKGNPHAFATFASFADARTALTINRLSPRLRSGEVRPNISVPRRFYQKEPPPAAYSDYSRVVHALDSHVRDSPNLTHGEKNTAPKAENITATTSGLVKYPPQDARSGLPKKPAVQLEAINLTESSTSEQEKSRRQQKSPPKKSKGKMTRDSPIKEERSTDDASNPNKKPEVDGLPAATIEDRQSSRAARLKVGDSHLTEPRVESKSNTAQNVCHATNDTREAIAQPPDQSAQLDSPQIKDKMAHYKSSPTHDEASLESKLIQLPRRDDSTAISAPEVGKEAEDNISDSSAKNNNSLHPPLKLQPETVKLELNTKAWDQAMNVNHGTTISSSEINDGYLLQNSPNLLIAAEELNYDSARESYPGPERPAPTFSNAEADPEACEPGETCGQEIATETPHTGADPVKQSEKMSTPTQGASAYTVKKCVVQQAESLHPFATKNKAQAKKEKETKRKQQKKEEADRIAKAKADRIASSKKMKSGADSQPNTEMSKDSATSSVTKGIHLYLEAASPKTEIHALEGMKKSKGESKAKVDSANEENNQKCRSENEMIADSSASAPKMTTSVPQETHRAGTADTPAGIEVQFDSFLSTSSSPAVPTPSTSQSDHAEPGNMTPRPSLSRHSSTSTVAGDNTCGLTDTSSAPTKTIETSVTQNTCTEATATKPDNTPVEAPKKKKKKKNKKKKGPAAEPSSTIEPNLSGNTHGSVQNLQDYCPYTSPMSHIDAIRYNIKHDTTSYFALTNARMEKEEEECEEQERCADECELTDALP